MRKEINWKLTNIENTLNELYDDFNTVRETAERFENIMDLIEELAYMTDNELKENAQNVIDRAFGLV